MLEPTLILGGREGKTQNPNKVKSGASIAIHKHPIPQVGNSGIRDLNRPLNHALLAKCRSPYVEDGRIE
jgi:hypothetical protein